jgi:hypothetical protein
MLTLYDYEIRHILDALDAYATAPEMTREIKRKLAEELDALVSSVEVAK